VNFAAVESVVCKIENFSFDSVAHRHEKRVDKYLSLDFFYLESFFMLVTYQQQRFDQLQKAFHHQKSLRQILF
jgi:hypothetical protein